MPSVPKDLFDFLGTARTAPSMDALDDSFGRLVGGWGFSNWTAIPIAAPAIGAVRPFQVVFGRPSPNWSKRYRAKNYFRQDAAVRALVQSNESIWWTKFADATRLKPEERKLFAEAREHGIAEGLSAPVRLANNSVWVCALTGSEAHPDWRVGDAARFAAERYLLRALDLRQVELAVAEPAGLTPAQTAIVRLLADGLNAKKAAKALNLSPRTVYNQIGSAKRRLRVSTIGELVRKAVATGLLI